MTKNKKGRLNFETTFFMYNNIISKLFLYI
jgi:hypothetical protein